MDALHAAGGVPAGWRFTLPPGDPAAGRQVYVDFKCYACHQIKGEQFPLRPGEAAVAGPDLTGMARHHPTEYLVESLVNPSAVLIDGAGYVGGDGRSIMPATPAMTLAQLIDLVAYLKSQGGDAGHAQDEPASRPRAATASGSPSSRPRGRARRSRASPARRRRAGGRARARAGSSSSSRTPHPVRPFPMRR